MKVHALHWVEAISTACINYASSYGIVGRASNISVTNYKEMVQIVRTSGEASIPRELAELRCISFEMMASTVFSYWPERRSGSGIMSN